MKKSCLRLFSMFFCLALALGCLVSPAGAENNAVIETGLFSGAKLVPYQTPFLEGFIVPRPEGSYWTCTYDDVSKNPRIIFGKHDDDDKYYVYVCNYRYPMGTTKYNKLYEDPVKQKQILDDNLIGYFEKHPDYLVVDHEYVENDGYPVVVMILDQIMDDGTLDRYGIIDCIRNSIELFMTVDSYRKDFPVTMDDLKLLASLIGYDESMAPLTVADTALTISAEGDPVTVSAGKSVQFNYAFANPEHVNKENKNDMVYWIVFRAGTFEEADGVSISAQGQLNVNKSLAGRVDLQVMALSSLFGSSATYNITAVPLARKVNLDPAELFFYTGSEEAQTVKASLEPAGVPNTGLTWTPVKKDLVEITEEEDGLVSIRPLKAGKTDIAVKEPGGKNAKLKVNVVEPVESVELKANGKVRAGGKVKIAATLLPKNAGNKTVQWSVDVGEDIAKIDSKGQLTIAKGVPSGTKISVTCTAVGAPVPVSATLEIEIP